MGARILLGGRHRREALPDRRWGISATGELCHHTEREADAAEVPQIPLFHVRSGKCLSPSGALPQGYFDEESDLDAIGIKYHTDKCSLEHNYLGKYAFFLERFRT